MGDNPVSEFELFDEKKFPKHVEELQILYAVINQIQFRGAKHFFFKPEGSANALPRVDQVTIDANKEDLGIRLYCIRLTDHVLVLLNGDIKTTNKPKDCPNVKLHFENAIKIAKKLDAFLMDKEID